MTNRHCQSPLYLRSDIAAGRIKMQYKYLFIRTFRITYSHIDSNWKLEALGRTHWPWVCGHDPHYPIHSSTAINADTSTTPYSLTLCPPHQFCNLISRNRVTIVFNYHSLGTGRIISIRYDMYVLWSLLVCGSRAFAFVILASIRLILAAIFQKIDCGRCTRHNTM